MARGIMEAESTVKMKKTLVWTMAKAVLDHWQFTEAEWALKAQVADRELCSRPVLEKHLRHQNVSGSEKLRRNVAQHSFNGSEKLVSTLSVDQLKQRNQEGQSWRPRPKEPVENCNADMDSATAKAEGLIQKLEEVQACLADEVSDYQNQINSAKNQIDQPSYDNCVKNKQTVEKRSDMNKGKHQEQNVLLLGESSTLNDLEVHEMSREQKVQMLGGAYTLDDVKPRDEDDPQFWDLEDRLVFWRRSKLDKVLWKWSIGE